MVSAPSSASGLLDWTDDSVHFCFIRSHTKTWSVFIKSRSSFMTVCGSVWHFSNHIKLKKISSKNRLNPGKSGKNSPVLAWKWIEFRPTSKLVRYAYGQDHWNRNPREKLPKSLHDKIKIKQNKTKQKKKPQKLKNLLVKSISKNFPLLHCLSLTYLQKSQCIIIQM